MYIECEPYEELKPFIGSPFNDFIEILPSMTKEQIKYSELRNICMRDIFSLNTPNIHQARCTTLDKIQLNTIYYNYYDRLQSQLHYGTALIKVSNDTIIIFGIIHDLKDNKFYLSGDGTRLFYIKYTNSTEYMRVIGFHEIRNYSEIKYDFVPQKLEASTVQDILHSFHKYFSFTFWNKKKHFVNNELAFQKIMISEKCSGEYPECIRFFLDD